MKLSNKGIEKVSRNCRNVTVLETGDFFPPVRLEGAENLTFEPDDFQGCVVLKVEEAKVIRDRMDWLWQNSPGDLPRLDKKLWTILHQRIEQAEKCHE